MASESLTSKQYLARHPAAFINVIHEDGTKREAVEWLQRTWDDYMDLKQECDRLTKLLTTVAQWDKWLQQEMSK